MIIFRFAVQNGLLQINRRISSSAGIRDSSVKGKHLQILRPLLSAVQFKILSRQKIKDEVRVERRIAKHVITSSVFRFKQRGREKKIKPMIEKFFEGHFSSIVATTTTIIKRIRNCTA